MAKKVASKKAASKNAFTPLSPADVAALLAAVPVEDWTLTSGLGYLDSDGEVWTKDGYGEQAAPITTSFVRCTRTVDDLRVTIALNVRACSTEKFSGGWDARQSFIGVVVEGHTIYNNRTFTRRGIDVSSCLLRDKVEGYEHEYTNLPALLAGEWQRCADAHARSLTMVSVPGLPGGWRVTPERRAQVSADLQASKRATFTPSGMGTGYEIMRTGGRFAVKLPAETSAFFGVTWSLYYVTIDCD